MENFIVYSEIGKGGYGTVVKAKDRRTGQMVALKQVEFADKDEGVKNSAIREVAIVKRCNHKSVIKILSCDIQDNALLIGYEIFPTDLRTFIKKHKLKESQIKIIIKQILEGMEHIHSIGIIHRDIKPHNILFDSEKMQTKIIDFGLSREAIFSKTQFSTNAGTKFFFAPEMMLGYPLYTNKVDVWGIGLVMSQLFSDNYAFSCKEFNEGLLKIFTVFGSYEQPQIDILKEYGMWKAPFENIQPTGVDRILKGASEYAKDLFKHLCDINWDTRYSATDALKHKWFEDISVE
ncbi:Kinase, CMGC CDK [Spironucleus salmonicida]|uniref:Kinase, CMGC CDK n=1 Tax=Spironucleus salmonicida TaxID=348837 RepID=V6LKQ5_9EUKA|nr:Kinase, CMGC CDK [Spironucleus salmonicida]|eukprot:EST45205.1 Kinase, CMGC CDK [Spironucleus salmonicida]